MRSETEQLKSFAIRFDNVFSINVDSNILNIYCNICSLNHATCFNFCFSLIEHKHAKGKNDCLITFWYILTQIDENIGTSKWSIKMFNQIYTVYFI